MNQHALVRQLKRISKERNESKSPKNKKGDFNTFLSLLAIAISGTSIYLQFFYYHHNLNASLIDGEIEKDSLKFELIYHNRGNQDATILNAEIKYFSDQNKIYERRRLVFEGISKDPFVLPPGKQIVHDIKHPIDFSKMFFDLYDTNPKDTLRIEAAFSFLNNNGLMSEKTVEVGWITLDSTKHVDYWSISHKTISLESDEYITRTYRPLLKTSADNK